LTATELRYGRRRSQGFQSGSQIIRELLKFDVKMNAYCCISAGCR